MICKYCQEKVINFITHTSATDPRRACRENWYCNDLQALPRGGDTGKGHVKAAKRLCCRYRHESTLSLAHVLVNSGRLLCKGTSCPCVQISAGHQLEAVNIPWLSPA